MEVTPELVKLQNDLIERCQNYYTFHGRPLKWGMLMRSYNRRMYKLGLNTQDMKKLLQATGEMVFMVTPNDRTYCYPNSAVTDENYDLVFNGLVAYEREYAAQLKLQKRKEGF